MKTTKGKKQTYKQPSKEEKIAAALKEQREKFIPQPPAHRVHKVGEMVVYGAHPNAEVVQVFDDGKYLELKIWGNYTEYGKEVFRENYTIVNWLDVVPLIQEPSPSLKNNMDIRLDYHQMTISSMFSYYYNSGIDMNPDYQRDYVWNEDDKVKLIDSIFNNRSIGSYILVYIPYGCGEYGYEVLDGKQRIEALTSFYEDRFQYKGKYFSELNYSDQCHFEYFMFPKAQIREAMENEVPREKKIKIFLHVNSCGRVMDEAHLEKVKAMINE